MTYAGFVSKIVLPFPGVLTDLKRRYRYTACIVVAISIGTHMRIMTCDNGGERKLLKRDRERGGVQLRMQCTCKMHTIMHGEH